MLWKIKPGALTRGAIDAAAGAAPAADNWTVVDSWVHSIDGTVAQVDVIGLAGYSEVRALLDRVPCASAGIRILQVSTNNGSSFLTTSGDYIEVSTAGVETNASSLRFEGSGVGSTANRSGEILISGWNLTSTKIVQSRSRGDLLQIMIPTASALNAVRISSGGNLTGGSIYVFAR